MSLLQAFIDSPTSSVTPSTSTSKECDPLKLSSNNGLRLGQSHTPVAARKVRLTSGLADIIVGVESLLDMASAIRNRVKELRDERGWTQQQLADATGVSRQSINSIERERYVPSLELALTFARVFRLPTDEIFSLEKKK